MIFYVLMIWQSTEKDYSFRELWIHGNREKKFRTLVSAVTSLVGQPVDILFLISFRFFNKYPLKSIKAEEEKYKKIWEEWREKKILAKITWKLSKKITNLRILEIRRMRKSRTKDGRSL